MEIELADFLEDDDSGCETCGSDTYWEDCHECGGDGVCETDDDLGRSDWTTCGLCEGKGGWNICLNPLCGEGDGDNG